MIDNAAHVELKEEAAWLMREVVRLQGQNRRMADRINTCIRSLARGIPKRNAPLWSAVGYYFGVGSTTATEMCRDADVDPDTKYNPKREKP